MITAKCSVSPMRRHGGIADIERNVGQEQMVELGEGIKIR